MADYTLHLGDCLEVMRDMPENSVDAICTDPPGGINFMGLAFDSNRGGRHQWIAWLTSVMVECLRVLKPGGHAVIWSLPRTSHWTGTAIEDAGFEIRDNGCHLIHAFGSGFPKSLNVGKAIDKAAPRVGMFDRFARHFTERRKTSGLTQKDIAAYFPSKTGGITGCVWNWENGANVPTPVQWCVLQPMLGLSEEWLPLIERIEAEREVIGIKISGLGSGATYAFMDANDQAAREIPVTAPATDAARQWDGWGTALKPAYELWWLARKPLAEPTIAANVLRHGTGAINVDACRVSYSSNADKTQALSGDAFKRKDTSDPGWSRPWMNDPDRVAQINVESKARAQAGRFPPNLLFSHLPDCQQQCADGCAVRELDRQSGVGKSHVAPGQVIKRRACTGYSGGWGQSDADAGQYSGVGGASRFFPCFTPDPPDVPYRYQPKAPRSERVGSSHPTQKPLSLMEWMCRLVAPPNGIILDPFAGSGTTGLAALRGGFSFVGIEQDATYHAEAERRLQAALSGQQPLLLGAD